MVIYFNELAVEMVARERVGLHPPPTFTVKFRL